MKLVDKPLTELQKRFARLYVEAFYGHEYLSNTEVAIKAGYSPDSSYQRAYELLNPKISPHVVMYIGKLKEDFKIKHNIDPDKHMARLHELGRKAEEEKMYGVAVNAEVYRGKTAGYYVEKKLIAQQNVDDMSEEELEQKMKKISEDYGRIASHEKEGNDETK